MIVQLYTFSPSSFVVADEWNANFSTIYTTNVLHSESINDATTEIAFPYSDLSNVYAAVRNRPNSSVIDGYSVLVSPEQEYYKVLPNGKALTINIDLGMNAEARILIQTQNNRTTLDQMFTVNYSGTTIISHDNNTVFRSGFYYIMIYETNNVAQVKLIWTGA